MHEGKDLVGRDAMGKEWLTRGCVSHLKVCSMRRACMRGSERRERAWEAC